MARCLAYIIRGRCLRSMAAFAVMFLLYNVSLLVQYPSKSSIPKRRSANQAAFDSENLWLSMKNPSIDNLSPTISLTSPDSIVKSPDSPPQFEIVAASPGTASSPISARAVEIIRSSSDDLVCNHVRNPSFEIRYATCALLRRCCPRAFPLRNSEMPNNDIRQVLRRHAVSRVERGHHRILAAVFCRLLCEAQVRPPAASAARCAPHPPPRHPFACLIIWRCSGDCSLRLQPGWAVQHVDVNQRSPGPVTLLLHAKATGLEPNVRGTTIASSITRCSLTCSRTFT
jgi:hypothetical protein